MKLIGSYVIGIGVRNPASFCSNSLSVSAKSTLFMEEVPAANEVQLVEVLDATNDDHGGVLVEMDKPMDSEVFVPILRASISHWKQQVDEFSSKLFCPFCLHTFKCYQDMLTPSSFLCQLDYGRQAFASNFNAALRSNECLFWILIHLPFLLTSFLSM